MAKRKLSAHKRIHKAMPGLRKAASDVNNLRISCNNIEHYAYGIALQHIWETLLEVDEVLNPPEETDE